jgi:hypothetical protein
MPDDTIEDIARRIDHAAEVYNNRGDAVNEREARDAARAVRESGSVERAREIEIDFNRGHDVHDIGDDS